jgi:pimeloyl-ACP methyl ester carboxylesterase
MRSLKQLTIIALLSLIVISITAQNKRSSLWFVYGDVDIKPAYTDVKPVCDCSALAKTSIPNTVIVSASVDTTTRTCRILAIVNHPPARDSVKVWIALPLSSWNGRFQGTGGGGFLGGSPFLMSEAIKQGFATGSTNTGHDGGSGSFALDSNRSLNWQLIRDNAYLGIHDMTIVGKELTKTFYGKPARYSYFVGGSTGGRQALSEAQRFPEDYDGILCLFPATNWDRFLTADLWPQVAMYESGSYISAARLAAINKAVVEAVDQNDGLLDSVISDPIHLQFDPKALVGKTIGGNIFTEKDAEAIRKIWEGPRTTDGKFLWYGLLPGTDMTALAGTKGNPLGGSPFNITTDWIRYFIKSDPNWQGIPLSRNDFQLLWNQSVEQYHDVFGTDNPDLSGFRDRKGKLLMLHGLSDQLIPTQGSIDYYLRVQTKMGGAKKTAEFVRLFLLPGLDHGLAGNGPKPTNHFASLVSWVEEGKAPEHINAELRDKSNNVVREVSYKPF